MDSHEIMQRIANSRIVFRDSFRDLEHFYNTINKDEIDSRLYQVISL